MISYNPSSARVDRDRVCQTNLQMQEMTALNYRLPRCVGFFPRGTHEIVLIAQPAGRCCASVWKRSLCSAPVRTHKYQSLHKAQPLVPHALPLEPAYKPEKVRRECLVILWTSVGPGYSRFMRQGCTDRASRGNTQALCELSYGASGLARSALASMSWSVSFGSRPPVRPRRRAAVRPAWVRSRIRLRSNSPAQPGCKDRARPLRRALHRAKFVSKSSTRLTRFYDPATPDTSWVCIAPI